jgi:hypothetical protein
MAVTLNANTSTGFIATSDTSGVLQLQTAGNTAVTVDASQNVGIGTASPNAKLNVVASSGSTGFRMDGGIAAFYPSYATANQGLQVDTTNLAVGSNAFFVNAPTGWTGNFISANLNGVQQFRIDQAGNLAFNSGYGSSAAAFGCRAWVNFNGTGTVAIRGSGNVSSITDNGGSGDYTVNFTTAMPDINYCSLATGTGNEGGSIDGYANLRDTVANKLVGSVRVQSIIGTSTPYDTPNMNVAIFR